MIGDFRYVSKPGQDCIAVNMYWQKGRRQAVLSVPENVQGAITAMALPALTEAVSIDSALGYAVVLSIRAGIPLRLSGDKSVWPPEWGHVQHLH